MGQQEIIEVLEKNKRPMTRTEIANEIGCAPKHVSNKIKLLIRFNEIKYMEIDKDKALEKYHCKRRMRLYYV